MYISIKVTTRFYHFTFIVPLLFLICCLQIPLAFAGITTQGPGKQDEKEQFTAEQVEFFEKNIRPLFIQNCKECHGSHSEEDATVEGGLSVSSRQSILQGGDSGPAVIPGHPDKSLLLDAVNHGELFQMPPDTKLSNDQIASIKKWIEDGAAWNNLDTNESVNKSNRTKEFNLEERKKSHWCWQPVSNPAIPKVRDRNWSIQSIDHFILHSLEQKGLTPAPPADRRTWIRRLTFDLIGLPPTPEKIEAFVQDPSPNAHEKVVDELLQSPHFGERWARHWLDLMRYAESYGHQYDYDMAYAHEYRDYLIRAFNEDVSYQQLIQEHIAGDLLSNPRRHPSEDYNESIIGTGFYYLGQAKPSAVDSRANEADLIDDRIDTLSKTFMGLTVSCARCHDHKFDAISTEDYYSLAGFFQSSRRQHSMLDPERKIEKSFQKTQQLLKDADHKVQQLIELLQTADENGISQYLQEAILLLRNKEYSEVEFDIACAKYQLEKSVLQKLINLLSGKDVKKKNHPLHLIYLALHEENGVTPEFAAQIAKQVRADIQDEKNWLKHSTLFADFSEGLPEGWFRSGYAFHSENAQEHSIRYSAHDSNVTHTGSIDSGRFGKEFYGVVRSPTFTLTDSRISYLLRGSKAEIRLVIDGFYMDKHRNLLYREARFKIKPSQHFDWQSQDGDIYLHLGAKAHIEIVDHGDGSVAVDQIRFSSNGKSSKAKPPKRTVFINQAFLNPEKYSNTKSLCDMVAAHWMQELSDTSSPSFSDLSSWILQNELTGLFLNGVEETCDHQNLMLEYMALKDAIQLATQNTPKPKMTLGITDGTSEDESIFIRGNHKTLGKVARRKMLSAICNEPFEILEGSGRLRLAEKVASNDNPLSARVAVNRVWHHLFGKGIVESVDNFGVLGKKPTHPELLNHLASRFMEEQWSFKKLIRSIVLSSTYRMSCQSNSRAMEIDPSNELLHHFRIRRLQSEAIRDSMLLVSGQLDRQMYGPSVPVHLTPFMTGRGRPKKSGPLDGERRRTIYVAVRRNFMSPMLLAFDSPVPLNTTGKRTQSNVPAQALILMNSPFVRLQAEQWAGQLCLSEQTVEQRIRTIYLQALGRPPLKVEVETGREFIESLAGESDVKSTDISQSVEIWREYCHLIFNLKEFIYIQ